MGGASLLVGNICSVFHWRRKKVEQKIEQAQKELDEIHKSFTEGGLE